MVSARAGVPAGGRVSSPAPRRKPERATSGRYYTALCLLQSCHVLVHLLSLPDAPLPHPPQGGSNRQPLPNPAHGGSPPFGKSLGSDPNWDRGSRRPEQEEAPPYVAMVRAWEQWRSTLNTAGSGGQTTGRCQVPPRQQQLCALQQLVRDSGTELLDADSPLPWPGALPARSLASELREEGGSWKTCAVVTNSGSLLAAEMGGEIDSHDAVLRFNTAPTTGFERHVGNKTTIRLINSLIVTKKQFNFHSDPVFRDVTLVLWDTPPPNCNVSLWNRNRNVPFFDAYVQHRRSRPHQHFFLLHPRFVHGAWKLVQENLGRCHSRQTPTSSGFLGVMLMMSQCEEVDVYDYIPPRGRSTRRCHYFEEGADPVCSMGGRHPITSEKIFALRLSTRDAEAAFGSGRLHLPGLGNLTCPHSPRSPQA